VVKLVAIDMDGTLLTSGKKITNRTRRVLKALDQHDIRIVLATAKPPRSVAKTYKLLGMKTCVICYNGALIYDPPSKKVLAHHPIKRELACEIINYARKIHPDILVSAEVLDHWFTDGVNEKYQTETAKEFKPDKLGPIASWLTSDVTKILLQGPQVYLTHIKTKLRQNQEENFTMAQSENNLLQIMAGDVSKGKALKFICKHYKIPIAQTIAIGDASNDIDMLKQAGFGVAMANAPERLKHVADYVTTTNDQDGVAEALERFVL
jgi:5-amino-6-(5-phospho-D-ribitylamino)uracil phosphatase